MKRILFAPSRTVALGLTTLLFASGFGVFSSNAEKGPPASSSSTLTSSATVDRASVSLGDRVVVTYAARIPAGATLTLDALVTPAPEEGTRPPGGAVLEFENPAPPIVTKSDDREISSNGPSRSRCSRLRRARCTVPGPHYTFEESPPRAASSTSVRRIWS